MRRALLLVALLAGCSAASQQPRAQRVTREQLRFEVPEDAARFDAALACFAGRGGWTARPLEVHGNFVDAHWCTWSGECVSPRQYQIPGNRWASVGTLHHPSEGAAVLQTFGVQVDVGEREPSGWSVSVSASSNGKGILGEHAFVGFERHDDPQAGFSIGLSYRWSIAEQSFFHRNEEDPWTWLARVRSSPNALRDEAITAWTALRDEVVRALEAGEVRPCVYGEYVGDGIPPLCVRRVAMPPDLVVEEVTRIEDRLRAVEAAVREADVLHARLVAIAPLDCF